MKHLNHNLIQDTNHRWTPEYNGFAICFQLKDNIQWSIEKKHIYSEWLTCSAKTPKALLKHLLKLVHLYLI